MSFWGTGTMGGGGSLSADPLSVQAQFVFALSALVEETHAMLDAATQRVFH